jgi:hypothetical protein
MNLEIVLGQIDADPDKFVHKRSPPLPWRSHAPTPSHSDALGEAVHIIKEISLQLWLRHFAELDARNCNNKLQRAFARLGARSTVSIGYAKLASA